jgi:hypothetical protein
MGNILMTDLDTLQPDIQDATLMIWPPAPVPTPATLRMLVRRAVEAMDEGAMRVDLLLGDGRRLEPNEIRQLNSRFQADR